MRKLIVATAAFYTLVLVSPAHAYIGPGLGAGAIGAILGLLAAVGLAVFAVVWYPIKRMMKKKPKQEKQPTKPESEPQ